MTNHTIYNKSFAKPNTRRDKVTMFPQTYTSPINKPVTKNSDYLDKVIHNDKYKVYSSLLYSYYGSP